MAISYEWDVNTVDVYPTDEGHSNVIYNVHWRLNATDTEVDADQTKGLTGGMTAGYISVLTKALQEQQTIIESLEARITALES
jgi:hypothetical protein